MSKTSKLFFASAVLNGASVLASPDIAERIAAQRRQLPQIQPFPKYPGLPTHALYNKFDAASQLVSISGNHAWQAPGPNDIRGPCAGLNAAANHGYLPRLGIADFTSVNTGLYEAFGLDHTATLFLQTTTTFFDGDPLSGRWSIGYHSPNTATLGLFQDEFLGQESGICAYGHLKSEGDASITRGDFLAPDMNSNCASYPQFFQELLDLAEARNGGNIDAPVLAEHQDNRKKYSIANNPNYFAPAFAGVAFTPAAHQFVFALMANHSAEYPRGLLTPSTLMDFFSYTRNSSGQLVYKYGYERIPDNWYKRAADDQWTLTDIVYAVAQQCLAYPNTCQVGGNVNGVNTFAGVNLGNISGGLFNTADLTNPAKLSCFIAQNVQAEVPTSLERVFTGAALSQVLALVPSMLGNALAPLLALGGGCTNLPPGKGVSEYGSGFPGAVIQDSGPRADGP